MEEFRVIKDYPDYSVSANGAIRNELSGRILNGTPNSFGYIQVGLKKTPTTFRRLILKHVLVAEAFLGQRPEGLFVNHKNGIKTDNFLSNLEYVTRSENNKHAYRLGLNYALRGADSPNAKLTAGQVEELRKLKGFFASKELAVVFGTTYGNINKILRGASYG